MFCPQCQVEYLPHVRRCSGCDVPLVEKLPVRYSDSEQKQRSGFTVFKEWGLFIVIPILLATALVPVALRDNSFGIRIASVIGYSAFVFLFVFCDIKGWNGDSLGEKAVRQKLPLLLCIHAGFLAVIFDGVTVGIIVHPHLSLFWTLERDRGGRGRFSNMSYLDLISGLTGIAIAFTQIFISRGILGRGSGGSADE